MPGPPSGAVAAGAGSLVVALGALGFGYLLAGLLPGRLRDERTLRAALAFPALLAYVLGLMLAHIASGGRVLSNAGLTISVTLAVGAGAGAVEWRRGRRPIRDRAGAGVLVGLLVLGAIAWGIPAFRALPLNSMDDINLHMGWANQLLNGETTPSAAITGDIPNFYPWLFHALTAFLARFSFGGRPFHALGALQFLSVWAMTLVLFALGSRVARSRWGGAGAATFGALSGGLGFLIARAPAIVLDPRGNHGAEATRYMGDMLFRRGYNSAFNGLAPPYPRDLAFVLVATLVLLLIVAGARGRPALAAGGVVLGMTGLMGAETFFVGVLVASLAVVWPGTPQRWWIPALVLVPAFILYALWAGPLLASYARFSGFVDSVGNLVALPPAAVAIGWGLVVPFAVAGLVRLAPAGRSDDGARGAALLLVAAVLLLAGSSIASRVLGEGFTTLGRAHRYWPLIHLGLVVYAAAGVAWAVDRLRPLRWGPPVLAGLVLAASLPSPILTSVAYARRFERPDLTHDSLTGDPDALLNVLQPEPGTACVAAVPDRMSFRVFPYTGFRLVFYRFLNLSGPPRRNSARVRWRDIYDHVPTTFERLEDVRALTTGRDGPNDTWSELVDKYGVDRVVVAVEHADSPVFAPFRQVRAGPGPMGGFVVAETGRCDGP